MKKKVLSIVLAMVICFCSVSVSAETVGETSARYLNGIIDIIADYYKYDVDKETLYETVIEYIMEKNPELLEGAISSATSVLDDYSVYYNTNELANFVTNVHQTYVGIGVTVQKSTNGFIIIEVNKSGGAYAAGVCVGDEIVAVNGEDVSQISINDVVAKIQGEAGTIVTIELLRGSSHVTLDIERKKINIETVTHEIIGDVGYIYISSFATATPEEVKKALDDIEGEHRLKKIIVDVRDNPGGELNSVIRVLEQFVPNGKTLVKFEYKNEKRNRTIESNSSFNVKPNREIVILANENSASASELFSGAMQYHKLAKVVGKTTFGKGSMQEMMGLINPPGFNIGDIKLTVAEFLKPDGSQINGVGIEPDVWVRNKFVDFDDSELTPMTVSAKYKIGDTHSDVLAIEERLNILGYKTGEVDGVYDNMTHQATKNFQADRKLHPYGVMDYTTQAALNDAIDNCEIEKDTQLERALEILK